MIPGGHLAFGGFVLPCIFAIITTAAPNASRETGTHLLFRNAKLQEERHTPGRFQIRRSFRSQKTVVSAAVKFRL